MEYIKKDIIERIYNRIGDDKSKDVFINRLLYVLTNDPKYIKKVICTNKRGKYINDRIQKNMEPIAIFGAGSVGKRIANIYKNKNLVCFLDNDKSKSSYEGLDVIAVEQFKEKYSSGNIIISSNLYWREMLDQLLKAGFEEKSIINLGKEYEKLNHLQYFDLPELSKNIASREVFIDGGCYDGVTSLGFEKWCKQWGCYEGAIYAWEPDIKSREICLQVLDKMKMDFELIPKGLWSKKEELRFNSDGMSSAVSDEGKIVIEVDSIDAQIDDNVTYIKLDIEGAEYQALVGAKKIIRDNKPKLAVCLYHKPEDIWELPQLILDLCEDYTLFFRHYSLADNETLVYAV